MDDSPAKSATLNILDSFSIFGEKTERRIEVQTKAKDAGLQLPSKKQGKEEKKVATSKQKAAEAQALKEARLAEAQRKKEEAEAKRVAAAEAAKQKAAEAQALKEARLAEVQRKKEEADAKRAAAAEAVKQRSLEAQRKREEAAAKRASKAKAEQVLQSARPASTISLFGFGVKDDSVETKPSTAKPVKVTKVSKAPRGVPVISKWRENRDGSVSGFISGSPSFEDGDAVTTSPIVGGGLVSGSVVRTGSGSR